MSTLLKIVSFLALAAGVFVAVITVIMLSNGKLDTAQRTPFILIMLIAFPVAILANWWGKRIPKSYATQKPIVPVRKSNRNRP